MSREPEMTARAEHSKLAKEMEKSRMTRGDTGELDKASIRAERFVLPAEGWGQWQLKPKRQKLSKDVRP